MTVEQLVKAMSLEILVPGDMTREVKGGHCGDLLSWVMSRAKEGDGWITVMGNVNAVAVAVLTDAACIILSDNAVLDEDARIRAEGQQVTILRGERDTYTLAVEMSKRI